MLVPKVVDDLRLDARMSGLARSPQKKGDTNMKHPWKRSLACLVALLLMLQLLPTGALAAGRDPGGRVAQVEAADASTQLLTNPLTDGEPGGANSAGPGSHLPGRAGGSASHFLSGKGLRLYPGVAVRKDPSPECGGPGSGKGPAGVPVSGWAENCGYIQPAAQRLFCFCALWADGGHCSHPWRPDG